MKSFFEKIGLSARRKTNSIGRSTFCVSGISISLFLLATTLSSCQGQSRERHSADLNSSIAADSVNKPKVKINVNRHYDDKGNIIGFDSTYSSFYSNFNGDTAELDSVMTSFDNYFKSNHSYFFDHQFNNLFLHDSLRLRYPDFFHDDFFMKRYELNDEYLRGMMQRMDSIKNHFYERQSARKKQTKDL